MENTKLSEVTDRLRKIFSEFSNARRPDKDSQMLEMWPLDIEEISDTEPISAIELEFDIVLDRDQAQTIYDQRLGETAIFLMDNFDLAEVDEAPALLREITPAHALRILHEMWLLDNLTRTRINDAIIHLEWRDRKRN